MTTMISFTLNSRVVGIFAVRKNFVVLKQVWLSEKKRGRLSSFRTSNFESSARSSEFEFKFKFSPKKFPPSTNQANLHVRVQQKSEPAKLILLHPSKHTKTDWMIQQLKWRRQRSSKSETDFLAASVNYRCSHLISCLREPAR